VPEEVFNSETIAFDMVYDPPHTSFLEEAARQGAELIRGDEMLIAQGLVQFQLFTGLQVASDRFSLALGAARARKEA
jgi:shikimate dehydrogenase